MLLLTIKLLLINDALNIATITNQEKLAQHCKGLALDD